MATPCFHRSSSTPVASRGVSPTMKRCAMCLTPAAAAAPSAWRPALDSDMRIATCSDGGRSSTSSRKPLRWRARSSSERQAGTTSTKRNSAARRSASCEARSIALSSIAFSGLRLVPGSAAARSRPTATMSASEAAGLATALDDIRRRLRLCAVRAPRGERCGELLRLRCPLSRVAWQARGVAGISEGMLRQDGPPPWSRAGGAGGSAVGGRRRWRSSRAGDRGARGAAAGGRGRLHRVHRGVYAVGDTGCCGRRGIGWPRCWPADPARS